MDQCLSVAPSGKRRRPEMAMAGALSLSRRRRWNRDRRASPKSVLPPLKDSEIEACKCVSTSVVLSPRS